jgi:RNA polymerase-interacting CarD/CdnL/TRCF family regulator
MTTTNNIKVGSYLIDSNQVYSIYKIVDDRLYYRPAVSGGNHPSVTGSIPAANAALAGFRPLLNSDEIKEFFVQMAKAKPAEEPIDSKLFKEMVITNDPLKIIPLLKQLWKSKNTPEVNFSGTSRDTLEDIISHLALEFSLSTKKSPESLRKKIMEALVK